MRRFDHIVAAISVRPKVLIDRVSKHDLRLSWNYDARGISEEGMRDFVEMCREQTQKESVELGQELEITFPRVMEPKVVRSGDTEKVIIGVSYSMLPGKELVWDDVIDGLKEGGWL